MKKILWLFLIGALFFLSCSKKEAKQSELIVFAAASLTETISEIATIYMKDNNKIKVIVNFDSSGTLKKQIEQGAYCDVFLSASQKQMDALDSSKEIGVNLENLDFVESETRVNILENKVTLVVPKGNPKNINSFNDLLYRLRKGDILLGMGNSDVPVGQYTSKILQYLNLDEAAIAKSGVITYGSNVKEVTTQVKENSVDCGIVYCTDAFSANLTVVDTANNEMCGKVVYPAAVMKSSKNKELANNFLLFIQSNKSKPIFEKVGFTPIF